MVNVRWLVLLAGVVTVAEQTRWTTLLAAILIVCAYNLPALRICSQPHLYERFHWYAGWVARILDTILISWATLALGPATSNIYLFYFFVVVGASVVYGWIAGLETAAAVSLVYTGLLIPAGALGGPGFLWSRFVGRLALLFVTAFFVDFLIREAEREREARIALDRLQGLYVISGELMNEINIESLLQMIIDLAIEQTDADRGSLMLADAETEELTIRAARGLPETIVKTARTKRGEGIAGYVYDTGEPVMLGDLARDSRFQHLVRNNQIISSLSVPISARGDTIGVLNVSSTGRRDPFTDNDLRLLGLLAGQASASIQNSRMFAELKSLAETDGLTGLYNRRYLDRILESEFHRAVRYGFPLSILIFDIDDFKGYNDSYGHLEGDDILRELANMVKDNIRISDIPARYGGEEFLVILTHTDFEGAKVAADRLRARIERYRFRVEQQGGNNLTISGGVASIHNDRVEITDFIQLADSALMLAKTEGKNRVYAAEAGRQPEMVQPGYGAPTEISE